jgi:hypothetical protein
VTRREHPSPTWKTDAVAARSRNRAHPNSEGLGGRRTAQVQLRPIASRLDASATSPAPRRSRWRVDGLVVLWDDGRGSGLTDSLV